MEKLVFQFSSGVNNLFNTLHVFSVIRLVEAITSKNRTIKLVKYNKSSTSSITESILK